jgi:hypothetical protein
MMSTLTSQDISSRVDAELSDYMYHQPPAGLHGVPWAEAKVLAYRDALRQHLVPPYKLRIMLRDTVEQIRGITTWAWVWVVARLGSYIVFFDDAVGDFGLAQQAQAVGSWASTGVRGDLVTVYCAA